MNHVRSLYKDFSSFFPGNESIAFQIKSSLGDSLTRIFQKVFDYRDSLEYPSTDVVEQSKYRLSRVYEYFFANIIPELKNTIFKETGLTINKIYAFGGYSQPITGCIAVDLTLGYSGAAVSEILTNMSGTPQYVTGPESVVKTMQSMADYFDRDQSKIIHKPGDKIKQMAVNIYFDVNLAFCVYDFIPNKSAEEFTAEELSAILMHEIGHAMSTVEHAADLFMQIQYLDEYTKSSVSKETAVSGLTAYKNIVYPAIDKYAKQLKKTNSTTSAVISKVNNTMNTLATALIDENNTTYNNDNSTESIMTTIGSSFSALICLCFRFLVFVIKLIHCTIFTIHIYGLLSITSDENARNKKNSDVMTTQRNLYLIERWADEFVVRQGYGAYLASGLNKIIKITNVYDTLMGLKISSQRLRNSSIFAALINVLTWVNDTFSISYLLDPVIYENDYNRLKRIVEDTNAFFREHKDVSIEIKELWLGKLNAAEAALSQQKTFKNLAVKKILDLLLRLTPVNIIRFLYNSGLTKDMEVLLDKVDAMRNNSLYATSARFAVQASHK